MGIEISRGTIVLIFIVGAFAILNGVLIFSIVISAQKLNKCKTEQNPNCPVITCNGDPSNEYKKPTSTTKAKDGTSSSSCWPYAYEEVKDSSGNILTYRCNYPYQGRIPLRPTSESS